MNSDLYVILAKTRSANEKIERVGCEHRDKEIVPNEFLIVKGTEKVG